MSVYVDVFKHIFYNDNLIFVSIKHTINVIIHDTVNIMANSIMLLSFSRL